MQKENQPLIIYYSILISSAILIISQWFLFNKGFFSISADEAGRTLDAFYFFSGQTGLYSIWLPFQKILYSIGFYVYFDLIWTPRIISVFFGIGTLISLVFLHNELFRNITAAIFTGLLASMYFGIVLFGVLPLIEIYFFFFTILSTAFLIKWIRTDKNIYLWITLILSLINNTTRYEAWVFSAAFLITIILNLYKKNIQHKNIYSAISLFILAVFPVTWLYAGFINTGETSSFITSVSERYNSGSIIEELKGSVLYNFFSINLMTLNILGLITIFLFYRTDKIIRLYINLLGATLFLVTVILLVTLAMPTHNSWRLAIIWCIMLLPFTAHWLYLLFSGENKFMKYSFGIMLILIIYFSTTQTFNMSQISFLSKEDYEIGRMFESVITHRKHTNKIFISSANWRYTGILTSSQYPYNFITDEEYETKYGAIFSFEDPGIGSKLRGNNIEYVLLETTGDQRAGLEKLEEFGYWSLYKIPDAAAASPQKK